MSKKLLTGLVLSAGVILIGAESTLSAQDKAAPVQVFIDQKSCEAVKGEGKCRLLTGDEAYRAGCLTDALRCYR